MPVRRDWLRALVAGAGAAAFGRVDEAIAQPGPYPTRPVKLIVPYVPGGATDLISRMLAERLTKMWPQPVVVENKPGAGAMLGCEFVARAPADGYTLLFTNTALVQGVALNPKLPIDPVRDFAAITHVTNSTVAFCVPEALGVRTVPEFVALMKANPGKHSYGSAGVGQTLHLYGEVLKRVAQIDLAHVPYKGEAAMVADLVAGHVSAGFASVATARPHIRAGKLRPIAVAGPDRLPSLPDVPTLREAGYDRFDAVGWSGLFATGGTPRPVIDRIATDVRGLLKSREIVDRFNELAVAPPVGSAPDEFARTVADSLDVWRQVVRDAGIKVE